MMDRIAVLNYAVMAKASQDMETDLANAKNKRGIVQKYRHMIPARSLPGWVGNPFDFGDRSETDSLYTSAAIGIGMSMHERLESFG